MIYTVHKYWYTLCYFRRACIHVCGICDVLKNIAKLLQIWRLSDWRDDATWTEAVISGKKMWIYTYSIFRQKLALRPKPIFWKSCTNDKNGRKNWQKRKGLEKKNWQNFKIEKIVVYDEHVYVLHLMKPQFKFSKNLPTAPLC